MGRLDVRGAVEGEIGPPEVVTEDDEKVGPTHAALSGDTGLERALGGGGGSGGGRTGGTNGGDGTTTDQTTERAAGYFGHAGVP